MKLNLRKNYIIVIFSVLVNLPLTVFAQDSKWTPIIEKNHRAIVGVFVDTKVVLDGIGGGKNYGTGLIIDAKRGWVVANQGVTRVSKFSRAEIKFYNGQTTPVKLLYYDPWYN